MDLGPSSSSTVSPGPGPHTNRKERGAIAAQHCTPLTHHLILSSLRLNKLARRAVIESKDVMSKGLSVVHVNDSNSNADTENRNLQNRLKSVESKIDHLGLRDDNTPPVFNTSQPSVYPTNTPLLVDPESQDTLSGTSLPPASPTPSRDAGGYRYDSSVSKVSEWPVVRQMFESLGQKPPSPVGEIPTLPRGLRESTVTLPFDGLQPVGIPSNSTLQLPLHFSASASTINLSPPSMDWETVQRLSKGYFDVINTFYPIMDRQWFSSNTLGSIISNGFHEEVIPCLVLLVLALGEVALTTSEVPISAYKQRPSGIKGGTIDRPPGLSYFNEARKRMGFALNEVSVENVQMFALAAIYYSSCGQALVSTVVETLELLL
ncbi:hypothetical protein FLONG3_9268 [Fusarium longipes]|uniref:Transcription factor domain-containing protein n=1 Tax=Fusarium longipes TaxID=694270 RepID=A0A395RZN6_9HYPO|nr:hypothetical protein FLONG3_9268 [Fusarium longipes]